MSQQLLNILRSTCETLCHALEDGKNYDESLCCTLEDILHDGLICDKDGLWNLLKSVSHHSQNDFLEGMENLSSHAGFIRAWIRATLNDGAISNALCLIAEDEAVKQRYTKDAFINKKSSVHAATAILKSLDKHELNYVCNTVALNQWRDSSNELPAEQPQLCSSSTPDPDSPWEGSGFARRFSVGNRLSLSCEGDLEDSIDSIVTCSSSDIPELKRLSSVGARASISDSVFSENPAVRWRNSQSDVRLSSISDLSLLPEEASLGSFKSDTEERMVYFTKISNEKGLGSQSSQCFTCDVVIGNKGQEYKVCNYDKKYYCRGCFGNYTHIIPVKLIYNWDHNKYRVSKKSYDFLTQAHGLPNLDISKLNISLYNHVPALTKVKDYRLMLNMSREYLVRCSSKDEVSFDSIRKKLSTHEYYWDSPHLYSLADLSKSFTGQLQNFLKKLAQRCTHHVYCCPRCSSLGFICEYCQNPKIIFPFELQTTEQCAGCSAVYHKSCRIGAASCPKCVRREQTGTRRTSVV